MPFLHWETDRRREKSAKVVREIRKNKLSTMIDVIETAGKRVESTKLPANCARDGIAKTITRDLKSKVKDMSKKKEEQTEDAQKRKHKQMQQKSLGQLLLCAAALAEAMEYATDERLLKKYLDADPPIHPRRTLDQFYYWTLKDTRTRDRDQVVYRGTAPKRELIHRQCVKAGCKNCKEIIMKRPRVVMVDQLWMFILDNSKCTPKVLKLWTYALQTLS